MYSTAAFAADQIRIYTAFLMSLLNEMSTKLSLTLTRQRPTLPPEKKIIFSSRFTIPANMYSSSGVLNIRSEDQYSPFYSAPPADEVSTSPMLNFAPPKPYLTRPFYASEGKCQICFSSYSQGINQHIESQVHLDASPIQVVRALDQHYIFCSTE